MGEFLERLFKSDFMPHGHCWRWEPWVVWTNVLPDALIALTYAAIATILLTLAHRRKDVTFDWVVVMFGVFTFACGCTHAMEVFNTWFGVFRLAGAIKAVTAAASLMTMGFLLQISPKLMVVPTLDKALAMDAELSSEKQEKHRVEGQLRETQDRYRILVDGIREVAIFLMDPEGRITSWNPGAERLTGYPSGEVLGRPFSRLFPEEDLRAGYPEGILRRAGAEGSLEEEGWRVRKDGSRFMAGNVISAFRDGQGALRGFTQVTRDITAQKASQRALQTLAESLEDKVRAQVQELRASEARLQGFIHHAPAAISFRDAEGRFLVLNPRMEELIGRSSAEVLGRTHEDLFPPEACARYRIRDMDTLRLRQVTQAEEEWPGREGGTRIYFTQVFPLVDDTGRDWGLGFIGTDITERKEADQSLLQAQKLESLGVMAGGIAHDFNNLLGAMQGNVDLASTEATLAQARPYLETLRGLIAKASGLLRQMLAYSGQGKASTRVLDLNQLVAEMTSLLGTSTSRKARLHLDLHPGPLPMVADPSQIQQVVMNLVINASEALGEGHGDITVTTGREEVGQDLVDGLYEGQSLRPGPHVSLEVADDGAGMAPEVLKRIFDPFFTTKFTGRGLGLAAIRGIVRSHLGGIRVTSLPGRGSTFRLLFPAARGPASAGEDAQAPPERGPAEAPGRGLVLVVDDEDDMRAVVAAGLRRAGFETLEARDGQEALDLYEAHREGIRLVLMDLTMPVMDGEEACRALRRRGATVPLVLSSGFQETEAMRRFEGLGLAGFLQKPFRLDALVALARKAAGG